MVRKADMYGDYAPSGRGILGSVLIAFVIGFVVIGLMGITFVNPGEVGVKYDSLAGGIQPDYLDEGMHYAVPFTQNIRMVEVRTIKLEAEASAASKDLQVVTSTIALNFHVEKHRAPEIVKTIGRDYATRIIAPAIQEAVKASTANFDAKELITKRPQVKREIQASLASRLGKYGLVVDEFNIINFKFSAEYDAAIEQKVVSEQNKLKAEIDLQKIMVEAEQKIARAEAEAESLRIQKQEVTSEMLKLRAIEKWNGVLPLVTGGGGIPLLDIDLNTTG